MSFLEDEYSAARSASIELTVEVTGSKISTGRCDERFPWHEKQVREVPQDLEEKRKENY
jgi:hypothetical protein